MFNFGVWYGGFSHGVDSDDELAHKNVQEMYKCVFI